MKECVFLSGFATLSRCDIHTVNVPVVTSKWWSERSKRCGKVPQSLLAHHTVCGVYRSALVRHLAFEVEDVAAAQQALKAKGVVTQEIRIDETTGKQFFFFSDPDGLPLEMYEK